MLALNIHHNIFLISLFSVFDESKLCKPQDVTTLCEISPRFVSAAWMENALKIAIDGYAMCDGAERVPPLALIRCSRGGKTRALKEMANALKHRLGPQASDLHQS